MFVYLKAIFDGTCVQIYYLWPSNASNLFGFVLTCKEANLVLL